MKVRTLLTNTALFTTALLLQGCGGSDDPPAVMPSTPTTLNGVFLDSPVANVDYKTATQSGTTDADGKYQYVAGETVTFSIGSLDFPTVAAASTVTPLDLADTSDPRDNEAVNILRLLQTLDKDGDPSNGIEITDTAKSNAVPVSDFDVPAADFATAVDSLIKDGGQDETPTALISAAEAVAHFENTLTGSGVTFQSLAGSWQLVVDGNDGEVILHFLPDGRFIALQWEETLNFEGFEYGTYKASNGKITFTTLENHDGEALTCNKSRGMNCDGSNESSVWAYELSDQGVLNITTYDTPNVVFNRLAATNSPIDGLWHSLGAKEIVHFTKGSATGSGNFFYVDYQAENPGSEAVFDLGTYTTVMNDGKSEISGQVQKSYNSTGDIVCDSSAGQACESFTAGYSIINQQLAIIDRTDRGYFDLVFANNAAPANTGTLVAQKQYANDIAANENYNVAIEDDYRTRLSTPDIFREADQSISSASIKFNIDEASALVRNDSASLETRLQVVYAYPGNEDRAYGNFLEVSVRLRNRGGAASAKYAFSSCLNQGCSEYMDIEKFASNLGDFNGDHTMKIQWNNTTEAFDFIVDATTVGSITMAEYNADPGIEALGGYSFDPSHYSGTQVNADVVNVQNEGESGYLAMHVDEVAIGDSVYDNFTAGLIDTSKWMVYSQER